MRIVTASCLRSDQKETAPSLAARITACALGVIAITTGALILSGMLPQLSSVVAYAAISSGGVLLALGMLLKQVEAKAGKAGAAQSEPDGGVVQPGAVPDAVPGAESDAEARVSAKAKHGESDGGVIAAPGKVEAALAAVPQRAVREKKEADGTWRDQRDVSYMLDEADEYLRVVPQSVLEDGQTVDDLLAELDVAMS